MPDTPLTVVVTGSRGLIGSELVPLLRADGHHIVRLVTGKGAGADDGTTWVNWDPAAPFDPAVLDGAGAVIHLAGENVAAGRWTDERKRRIRESRTIPTRNLAGAIAKLPPDRRPGVFLCASAVGYYGDRGDEVLTEDSSPGTGFLADVCREWEAATGPAHTAGVRVVNLRFGIVLSAKGGALAKQLLPFRLGLGAALGSGKQWVPWVAVDDVIGAIRHGLTRAAVSGPANLVAPTPVTNREFTKTLARVLGRPAFLRAPRFALRLLFGDLADEGLLASTRAVPAKLQSAGYEFRHPELAAALQSLLGRA